MNSRPANKLFVYGTLLQGEQRNSILNEWELVRAAEIPGVMYDTGAGYPAVDFSDSENTVSGELYTCCMDNADELLGHIDSVEGVDESLFRRVDLYHNKEAFYAYEAGHALNKIKTHHNRIDHGNWRQIGSVAHDNPCLFAINFESVQSRRYGVFPGSGCSEFVHLKGNCPILIVSHHATAHRRKDKIKTHERYTGAIGVILNAISGVHTIYTVYASEFDSNYCESTRLKEYIKEVVEKYKIKFVIDIHGTGSYRKFDLYPGIGRNDEFINGNSFFISELERVLFNNSIRLGGRNVFPAYRQHTVSRFVNSGLGIPAMQIEINQRYRNPISDKILFEKLIHSLAGYIGNISKLI